MLENIKKVYVIGIKGSGIISMVEILKSKGIEVQGSDVAEKFFTDEILQKNQIKYFEKFSAENIPYDIDLVIYSTVYNEKNNVEFQEALKRKLPMLSYPEILAQFFNERYGVAVCGTHGKTTTSAWLANTLKEVGVDPAAAIGSRETAVSQHLALLRKDRVVKGRRSAQTVFYALDDPAARRLLEVLHELFCPDSH